MKHISSHRLSKLGVVVDEEARKLRLSFGYSRRTTTIRWNCHRIAHTEARAWQAPKALGYRSLRNLVAMTYLIAGKLDPKLPT